MAGAVSSGKQCIYSGVHPKKSLDMPLSQKRLEVEVPSTPSTS